ncbi:MAG: hypothetical protein NTZ33_05650 [Bacteroidetes bacterium]|nr:hypothetical protein [Bacteroidota bacterium]
MKKFNKSNDLLQLLKPIAMLFLFFTLYFNVNAQVESENSIKEPLKLSSTGSFNPGVIIGSNVTLSDVSKNDNCTITYEWQSATDEFFTQNLTSKLAETKDYNPGTINTTIYIRRVVYVKCKSGMESKSSTGGIKFTIN